MYVCMYVFLFCADATWKKVDSSYRLGSIFLIDLQEKLYCLEVNGMKKIPMDFQQRKVHHVSCTFRECWVAFRDHNDYLVHFNHISGCSFLFKHVSLPFFICFL